MSAKKIKIELTKPQVEALEEILERHDRELNLDFEDGFVDDENIVHFKGLLRFSGKISAEVTSAQGRV